MATRWGVDRQTQDNGQEAVYLRLVSVPLPVSRMSAFELEAMLRDTPEYRELEQAIDSDPRFQPVLRKMFLAARPIGDVSDVAVESAAPDQTSSTGAVEVTTIVGAKGLSADHVIVLGCDDVNLAPVSRSAFFVAMTRARKSLTLLACMGGGGAKQLHEFVYGLPEQHTRACQVKTGCVVREFDTVVDPRTHLGETEYAKRMAAQKRAGG
jgi:UvrD-like helicase C-terminal domain